jgi:hypothetical protein
MNMVKTMFRIIVVLFLLLGAGCAVGTTPAESLPAPTTDQALPVTPPGEILTTTEGITPPTGEAAETQAPITLPATAEPDLPGATSGSDCLGDEINPIASSIAADYESTSYTEVMTWFCNGAEFEDILTALMTEDLTGVLAEELLEMLADGFSWDEIWRVIGLTE